MFRQKPPRINRNEEVNLCRAKNFAVELRAIIEKYKFQTLALGNSRPAAELLVIIVIKMGKVEF